MITTPPENRQLSAEPADIVSLSRHYADRVPARGGRRPEGYEDGAAIVAILEPLGLTPPLLGAARLYPLVRSGSVRLDDLQSTPLGGLCETIEGLVELGRFSLPPGWQPGEALAVSQSEALRKMLLAVVADARLVVIRIAEQLHRLRRAKEAPPSEQRAIALEAREIHAALANRRALRTKCDGVLAPEKGQGTQRPERQHGRGATHGCTQ